MEEGAQAGKEPPLHSLVGVPPCCCVRVPPMHARGAACMSRAPMHARLELLSGALSPLQGAAGRQVRCARWQ